MRRGSEQTAPLDGAPKGMARRWGCDGRHARGRRGEAQAEAGRWRAESIVDAELGICARVIRVGSCKPETRSNSTGGNERGKEWSRIAIGPRRTRLSANGGWNTVTRRDATRRTPRRNSLPVVDREPDPAASTPGTPPHEQRTRAPRASSPHSPRCFSSCCLSLGRWQARLLVPRCARAICPRRTGRRKC